MHAQRVAGKRKTEEAQSGARRAPAADTATSGGDLLSGIAWCTPKKQNMTHGKMSAGKCVHATSALFACWEREDSVAAASFRFRHYVSLALGSASRLYYPATNCPTDGHGLTGLRHSLRTHPAGLQSRADHPCSSSPTAFRASPCTPTSLKRALWERYPVQSIYCDSFPCLQVSRPGRYIEVLIPTSTG